MQAFAQSGKIIAKIGNISDLSFLDNKKNISILDVSNILDYFVLNINTQSKPIIITTEVDRPAAKYASSIYQEMTDPEKIKELKELLDIGEQIVRSSYLSLTFFGACLFSLLKNSNKDNPNFPKVNSSFYSEFLLDALKKHKEKYWFQIRDEYNELKWIDFTPEGNYKEYAKTLPKYSSDSFNFDKWLEPLAKISISKEVRQNLLEVYNSWYYWAKPEPESP